MPRGSNAIALPGPLRRQVDALAQGFLHPAGAAPFDFATPPGEPALAAPESVSWRVFKSPLSLFIGGVTAVLLELAEPRVRDGVWTHSSFRTDALTRLQRTGLAAMITVYGARSRAEAMIAGVGRAHARVAGVTTDGEPYSAADPALLDWVQATASFGFMQAFHVYVRALTPAERDALLAEGRPASLLYGATGAPVSEAELRAQFEAMKPRLVASPIIFEFLNIMARAPVLPAPARALQPLLLKAAVDLLPPSIRNRLQLGPAWSLKPWEGATVRAAAVLGDRLFLPSSPAVQACRRLGLPDDWLYG